MSRLWGFRAGFLLLARAAGCARVHANNEMGARGAQLLKKYFPVIFSHPWYLGSFWGHFGAHFGDWRRLFDPCRLQEPKKEGSGRHSEPEPLFHRFWVAKWGVVLKVIFRGFPGAGRILRTCLVEGDLGGLGCLSHHPQTADGILQTARCRLQDADTQRRRDAG